MQLATFRRSRNFVLRFVKNVWRRKLPSFKRTTRGLTLHAWPCRQFKRKAGNFSPIHPTVWIWLPQTTTYSGPWKITWEVTTMRLTRQFRKPREAGCEEMERNCTAESIFKILQRWQKCIDRDGYFISL
jgi:hypothetical protein